MTAHSEIFAFAVSLVLAVLLAGVVYSYKRAKQRTADPSLESLVARLAVVDRNNVSLIACAYGQSFAEAAEGHELEGWQMWEMLGGMKGLEVLAANCEVLVDLACHVQHWYPEALPVAEQLRLNAREVQWHVDRLKGAEQRGNLAAAIPDYTQRAVAVYFRMTQNVLVLYETSQVPGWTRLQATL